MIPNYVYVIETPDGLVKVGVSRNPQARLGGLQGGMPLALKLVRTWPRPHGDAVKVERTAHRLLHPHRQGTTEWFKVATEAAVEAVEKDDPDDYAFLADGELGEAPDDPGTYEGGHGKPMHPDRHNKWCVRECERSEMARPGERITVRDFSRRYFNMPHRHREAATHG